MSPTIDPRFLSDFSDLVRQPALGHLLDFSIAGIEITQAVQHYRSAEHLTDPADQAPDNAVELIANQPACVRVYVRSLITHTGLTATLELQRRTRGLDYDSVTTYYPLAPVPTKVRAASQTSYQQTRRNLAATFNFIIEADQMIGDLQFIARVTNPTHTAQGHVQVNVTLRQTLQLAGVMIDYDGPDPLAPNAPNITLAAPTIADLQAMSAITLALFPVRSLAHYRSAGTLTQTDALVDPGPFPASGCGASWNALHARVVNARTADGNRPGWIYYGLLPSGVPVGQVGGCGLDGVAVGRDGHDWTLAHECAHAAGLPHAPAGGAPNPDANYPAYEPYDTVANRQGSIGEYGLDLNTGDIADPQTFRDLLGYAWPKWISPYNYSRLTNNPILNPVSVAPERPWWADIVDQQWRSLPSIPRPDPPLYDFEREFPIHPPAKGPFPMISVIVLVTDGEVAEVTHVARTTMYPDLGRTARTPFQVQLRAADEAIASAPLRRLVGCQDCGCDDPAEASYLAQALLPDQQDGDLLVIRRGDEVVWERQRPDEPARVEDWDVTMEDGAGLAVRWEVSGSPTELWLRWSRDNEDWHVLATGLQGDGALIAAEQLPAGQVLLQLIAHDGFNSSPSETKQIELPQGPPHVAILHPTGERGYRAGTIRLWGSATGTSGEPISGERAVWTVDGEEVGRGFDLWVELAEGDHRATLVVDGEGGATEVSVDFTVA